MFVVLDLKESYANIFCSLKKLKNLKKHEFVFWKINKLRKHGLSFCKLQKDKKNMNLIFSSLKKLKTYGDEFLQAKNL